MSRVISCHRSPLLLALLLLATTGAADAKDFLEGVTAKCYNEGEPVQLPLIDKNPCISCICKNKEVVCKQESCSAIIGCHLILPDQRDKCCAVCKGCMFKGQEIRSSTQWSEPSDPCIVYKCLASAITQSRLQCHVPCANPLPPAPGECCAQCQGCLFNKVQYKEGDVVPFENDRCLTCVCKNGSITCSKRACPVLTCPDNKTVMKPGACCLECKGMRKVFELKNKCLFGTQVYKNGAEFYPDDCTQCECQNSTSVCERKTCAPLDCPAQYQVRQRGSCCAICSEKLAAPQRCNVSGVQYENGAMWKLDDCTNCMCQYGEVRCYVEQCNQNEIKKCPPRHRLKKLPGECCAQCVEDAVCTVFGDPHYRTFDGVFFNFQGACKYVLSEDCHNKTFYIRVRNDARSTASFSWTKTVFFKVGKTKVTLEQRMKVKVNRIPVSVPHNVTGVVNISKEGFNIVVRSQLGVNVIWDGDSFLEITVPPSYKNKLCGMCGNYNGAPKDDFKSRTGNAIGNAEDFAASWKVGSLKQCSQPVQHMKTKCKNMGECNKLMSKIFEPCHKLVKPIRYYDSCRLDMCECPHKRRCYCEAFTAYAHECSRYNVHLEWRNQTKCGDIICPKGGRYETCGSPCVKTCRNWRLHEQCMKPCVAGCQCPPGTVLHRNRCIKPHRCPKRTLLLLQ